jgi:LacI family transcriptional regulator
MTAGRRITMKEVARAAGVSTQTVSRVLNNRPDVAPETFARVQQVINETGYAPNMLARSLTQGRSHVLGVVAYGLDYFGPSRILTGIEQQAAAMGYGISLNLIHAPETDDVDRLLNNLVSRQVDGIIWAIPPVGNNRAWARNKSSDFPVPIVLVGGIDDQIGLPSITIDNRAIGRLATEHLLTGGVRYVGIITGPLSWWEARQRELGWREALALHGLIAEDRLVAVGDWTPDSGMSGLNTLLEREPRLDAVFASNDQMALGVLRGAHRVDRRIPEELSVVGVDDMAESSHFWPSLTTVHQPLRDAGALAVKAIHGSIVRARAAHRPQDAGIPHMTILEPELIVRESSRRPTVGQGPNDPGAGGPRDS